MALSKAVETAIRMESDAIKFYREAVGKTSHPLGRKLFEALTAEEKRHYELLDNTYKFLDDTGNWFMWEEPRPLEG